MFKFKQSRLFFICSTLFSGLALLTTVHFLLIKTTYNQSQVIFEKTFNGENEKDVRRFYKNVSVSLSVIIDNLTKVNGTAWIKSINDAEVTFVTNLHVLSSFIKYDVGSKMVSLDDNSFNEICIKYFKNPDYDNISMSRIKSNQWSVNIPDETFLVKRQVPKQVAAIANDEIINTVHESAITNGYIDYIELKYNIDNLNNENKEFNDWLKAHNPDELPLFSEDPIHDLSNNDYLYLAGFPIYNSNISWVEKKILIKKASNNVSFSTAVLRLGESAWLSSRNIGIKLVNNENNKTVFLRNVAKQLVLYDVVLGGGSSGSLVVKRNKILPNRFDVVGIWWGTYGNHNGAIDILNSEPFNPCFGNFDIWNNILWPKYNIK